MNSGMMPNLSMSSGITLASTSSLTALGDRPQVRAEAQPGARRCAVSTICSSPANAPPQMNRMLVVSIVDELLVRVLAAALRRDVGDGALKDLQQGLLDTLARRRHG